MTLALLVQMREQDPGREELDEYLSRPDDATLAAQQRLLAELRVESP